MPLLRAMVRWGAVAGLGEGVGCMALEHANAATCPRVGGRGGVRWGGVDIPTFFGAQMLHHSKLESKEPYLPNAIWPYQTGPVHFKLMAFVFMSKAQSIRLP